MTDSPKIALLPCPFCGSAAELQQGSDHEWNPDAGGYFIECRNALCGVSTKLVFPCGDDPRPGLIAAWNRRAALLDRAPAGVTVNPLEWEEDQDTWGESGTAYCAKDPWGEHYRVHVEGAIWFAEHDNLIPGGDVEQATKEAAFAVCQADHDRRVLSCLVSAPAGVGEWQPIEEAPKDGRPVLTYSRDADEAKAVSVFGLPGTPFIVMRWSPISERMEAVTEGGEEWINDWTPTHWRPLPAPPPSPFSPPRRPPSRARTRMMKGVNEMVDLCEDEGCDHYGTPHVCVSAPAPQGDVREAARVLLAGLMERQTLENIAPLRGAYEAMARAFYHGPDDGAPPFWRAMRAFFTALAQEPRDAD